MIHIKHVIQPHWRALVKGKTIYQKAFLGLSWYFGCRIVTDCQTVSGKYCIGWIGMQSPTGKGVQTKSDGASFSSIYKEIIDLKDHINSYYVKIYIVSSVYSIGKYFLSISKSKKGPNSMVGKWKIMCQESPTQYYIVKQNAPVLFFFYFFFSLNLQLY